MNLFNILGAFAGLVVVHEFGHIVTAKLLTGKTLNMRLTYTWRIPTGARWDMPRNAYRWQRIAIALSGFVAEFMFILIVAPQWWWLGFIDLATYKLRHKGGGDFNPVNFR